MFKPFSAEFFGTFWLVLGGCGSALISAAFPQLGIGFLGVALAFGLTVVTMAYAVGHISGAHFNPAVGGIAAAAVLYGIASGKAGFDATTSGFAANGYGLHSPGGYALSACMLSEFVLSAFFVRSDRKTRSCGLCATGDWSGNHPVN
ncbi:putative aquaporin [Shigella sonnei]|nr:putative aquaporin [Shigella sonnei]